MPAPFSPTRNEKRETRNLLSVFLPDAAWRRRFRRRLAQWFALHARDLPWRRHRDPYAIWVSEIMLQQTQVATVEPYFLRFLQAFPTVADLAQADTRPLMRLWEGLGYYRRAQQLHDAAKMIVREHEGAFPREFEAVRRLPGIGRYTAGAILSIAFDARLPILEANTVRVFSRLLAYDGDTTTAAGQKLLWAMAEAVLPERGVGQFNQALMELGSQVCLRRTPRCTECPVAMLCLANARNLQANIPRVKEKPPAEARHEAAVIVGRKRRVLLLEIPAGQRWAGLWDFPRFAVQAENGPALLRELTEALRRQTGIEVRIGRRLAQLTHSVTRFRITLDCYEAEYVRRFSDVPISLHWLRPEELEQYPLCTSGRKLSRMVR